MIADMEILSDLEKKRGYPERQFELKKVSLITSAAVAQHCYFATIRPNLVVFKQ